MSMIPYLWYNNPMTTLRAFIENSNTGFLRRTIDAILPELKNHGVSMYTFNDRIPSDFENIHYHGTHYTLFMPSNIGPQLFCETLMIELARIVHHQESLDTNTTLPMYPPTHDVSFQTALATARHWMLPLPAFEYSYQKNQGLTALIASDFGVSKKWVEQHIKALGLNNNLSTFTM